MPDSSLLILIPIILFALGFGVVNGFNDAANAIATSIGSRALAPRHALMIAVVFNMLGAATGTAVAQTVGKGVLIPEAITYQTIIAALAAVILWTSLATYLGLPVSLTHGFVAALAMSGIAAVGTNAVNWGIIGTVLSAVITAPVLGFIGGFIVMTIIFWVFRKSFPAKLRTIFSRLQIPSTAFMAYSHGKNDGQMPIGIITMAMILYTGQTDMWESIPWWIIIISALSISFGTAIGGWRVIRTLGMRITNLRPEHGFAAQTAAASVIEAASHLGIPVSTTHSISAAVMGVGATKRLSAVRWGVAGNMVSAWVITFPVCGGLGFLFSWIIGLF
ncbi:MAG: inorganic phosphate transporter [Dehalococcoidales bacterium]|nr:inorganic phosphate transporter [Dehalococcoidales bacterium]